MKASGPCGKPDTLKKAYRHTGDWTAAFLATLRNYPLRLEQWNSRKKSW